VLLLRLSRDYASFSASKNSGFITLNEMLRSLLLHTSPSRFTGFKREMFDKEQLSEAWSEWKKQREARKGYVG